MRKKKDKEKSKTKLIAEFKKLRAHLIELDLDGTEYKQIEEVLGKDDEKYRDLFESSRLGFYITTPDGRIKTVSQALVRMQGYDNQEELMKADLEEDIYVSPEDMQKLRDELNRKGYINNYEINYRCKDGRIITCLESAVLIRDEEGNIIEYQGAIADISKRKRLEEALRENEEKYRTLANNINIGLYRATPGAKGKFIEANPAVIKMSGFKSKDEFLAINVSDLYQNPEDRGKFSEELLKKEFAKNEELLLKKKDGTPFIGSVSTVPVKDEKGNVLYYDGIIEDITERKKAEEALRDSEEKYRSLADQSLVGIFILQDGGIVYANQGLSDITGYSINEMLNWESEEFAKLIHPEDRSFVMEQGRKKQIGEIDVIPRYSYCMITKSGNIKWVEIYSRTMLYSGRLAVQGIMIDITERSRAEEALKESEERFKGIFENANDSIVIIDKKGFINLANPRFFEITGYTDEEIKRLHFSQLIHPEDKDIIISHFNKVIAGELDSQRFEVRAYMRNGSIRYIDINANAIKKKDEIIGIQAIIRDITEKKILEDRLKENYKELVKTIATFIEIKDLYTEEHSRRIVEDSIYLAQRLNMSEKEIKDIEIAALLHDLGKIKIPGKILNKPGRLNKQEELIIKKHCQLGEEAIKNMPEFSCASKIIRYHHERYDGKGYPDGLRGEKIPLGARIIALVDAFDAMLSDRPYRKALSYKEAKAELIRERGKQFDPQLTDIYLTYLKDKYESE